MYVQKKYSSLHDKKLTKSHYTSYEQQKHLVHFARLYCLKTVSTQQKSVLTLKWYLKNVPCKHFVNYETTHLFLGVWEERLVEWKHGKNTEPVLFKNTLCSFLSEMATRTGGLKKKVYSFQCIVCTQSAPGCSFLFWFLSNTSIGQNSL